MKDVINRLKESKQRCEDNDRKNGVEAGKNWAIRVAEWDELSRLNSEYEQLGADFISAIFAEWGGSNFFVKTVSPNDDSIDWNEWEEFWMEWYGRKDPTAYFVLGFWEGALSVFAEIEHQV